MSAAPKMSVAGRLFQARMWREYAQAWDGKKTMSGCGRAWVENILRIPRAECLRRARVNVYLARRMNRMQGHARELLRMVVERFAEGVTK